MQSEESKVYQAEIKYNSSRIRILCAKLDSGESLMNVWEVVFLLVLCNLRLRNLFLKMLLIKVKIVIYDKTIANKI